METGNRTLFLQAVDRLVRERDFNRRCEMAAAISDFAWDAGCGYYASPRVEKAITAFADSIEAPDDSLPRQNTILMVMSSAEKIGGHTRVVERWIEQDPSRAYSVVVLNQTHEDHVPPRLLAAVKASGGEFVMLDAAKDRLARAKDLRMLALRFEKVVLHVDMDELITLLAFGTTRFQRPVGLFNHADHVFWLGVSIADRVAEFRRFGDELSRKRRGVTKSTLVGIPSDVHMSPPSATGRPDVRVRYGIPSEAPIILTCGRANKYEPVLGLDLLPAVEKILKLNPQAYCMAVGFTLADFAPWRAASARCGGRLLAVGSIPNGELSACFAAADLVLDSYPMGGATALADALVAGCPILCVIGPVGHADWVSDCQGRCQTMDELVDKAAAVLADRKHRDGLLIAERESYFRANRPELFKTQVDEFFANLTLPHRVRDFAATCEPSTDLDRYHFAMSTSREDLFPPLGRFLAAYRETSSCGIRRILEVCGWRIVLKWRRSPFATVFPDLCKKCYNGPQ